MNKGIHKIMLGVHITSYTSNMQSYLESGRKAGDGRLCSPISYTSICIILGTHSKPSWASLGCDMPVWIHALSNPQLYILSMYWIYGMPRNSLSFSPGSSLATPMAAWWRQAGCPGRKAALCQRWKRSITNNAASAVAEREKEREVLQRACCVRR